MQNFTRLILKRQKEEILSLKRELRQFQRERNAYKRFYRKTLNRYGYLVRDGRTDLFDWLEANSADYPAVCNDPAAILDVDMSQRLKPAQSRDAAGTDFSKGLHCQPLSNPG